MKEQNLLSELHDAMRQVYKLLPKVSYIFWDPKDPVVCHLQYIYFKWLGSDEECPKDLVKIIANLIRCSPHAMTHYDDQCEQFRKYCDENLGTDPNYGNYYIERDLIIKRVGDSIQITFLADKRVKSTYYSLQEEIKD